MSAWCELSGNRNMGAERQLVCLPVFKTGVGRIRPGWVRFPYALARKKYKDNKHG